MGAFDEEWHKKTPLNTENIFFFSRKENKNTTDDDSPRLIKNNGKT